MSANIHLSRRQFLQAGALLGGGLVLGFRWAPAGAAPAASGFTANAWIAVRPDGRVQLVCPRNEMGQDVHTSLSMLLAEELGVDPRTVEVVQAPADPAYVNGMLGAQITGGSTSVRDSWIKLRQAGAAARTMLVGAAAAMWDVPAAECTVADGQVVHGTRTLAFGALADAAAKQPVPKDVPLKPRAEFRLIGRPLARLDGAAKARGQTVYGIDIQLPGLLHAALLPCPVHGGKVASFDGSAAAKRPGVRKVVSIGEGVAVIADHWWQAQQALAELKVQWDEGAQARLDNAAIYATLERAKEQSGARVKQAGDVEAVFARSKPIEARYTSQMLAHVTMEPQNCTARVGRDGVDVWASNQHPQRAQALAAQAAGVKPERVRIHSQQIGGGFGRRLDTDYVAQAVAIAKAVPGTPVKLIWSREDDVRHDVYRPPALHLLRGSVQDGRVHALAYTLVSPSITNRMFPGVVKDGIDGFMVEGVANLTYGIPNLDLRTVIQEVGVRVGYWRSVSNALNAFAIESFIDELAHAAGADPVAFRAAMLDAQPRQRAVLERAAKEAGWTTKPAPGRAFGVASMECYDTHLALVAEISGDAKRVKLERLTFAVDPGIAVHPDQIVAQLQGGAINGLIDALRSKITFKDGRVEQANFGDFPIPRIGEVPPIAVHLIEGGDKPGGIGETGVPLVAPAIANAVFALTGQRIRSLPLADGGVTFA
ncbi:MAG: xanthine dehydrogenase family protein molybdopterin-binding subunit [Rhodanobacteraceae bacterium]|jgi:CO/xanthine dehydrogenase Mo-binding subunit|nr:xanthine dehydrogenase family protein molybdopterin-binding subunit [Rhodanobacteraceae bacterium]